MSTIAEVDRLVHGPTEAEREAYRQKQVHAIPITSSVKRMRFLIDLARGQHLVDLGASGPLAAALKAVAASYLGLNATATVDAVACDLERDPLPPKPNATLVICGETLEHLSNPGLLLDKVRTTYPVTLVLTVPNATAERAQTWVHQGIENVNIEHVAYYSYRTLRTLVERHGYVWRTWHWYNGAGPSAEGLIAVVEPR